MTTQKNNFITVINKVTLVATVVIATLVTSCKSNTEKEAEATENVVEATENLKSVTEDMKNDTITKANDAEWQTYKTEAYNTISDNETRIVELQNAIKKPGNTFDSSYKKSIKNLETKNEALQTKITDYENNKTDWDTFKREFDADMLGLKQAMKDLSVNNKK